MMKNNNKQEIMMADIDDLLDYAYQKNYAKADAVFNDLIGTKL